MKRTLVSSFTAVALLAGIGFHSAEGVALAAQKRKAAGGKPALQRRARTTRAARAVKPRAITPAATRDSNAASGVRAEVVGPVYVTHTLPKNQYFRLRMNQTLSSETARKDDRFKATVVTPVYVSGVEVVPAGAIVEGRVTSVHPARTRGREGQIAVAFDTLVLPDGTRRGVDGTLSELQDQKSGQVDAENEVSGRSSDKEKLIYIGGGGVGGAVLGGAIGGAKGAAIGAIIGAGAGVAGVLVKKGNEAELRGGTEIGMTTTQPIVFSVKSDALDR